MEKISVTIPTDTLWAIKADGQSRGENRSQTVTRLLSKALGIEGDDLPPWGEDHENRIKRLEEVAGL